MEMKSVKSSNLSKVGYDEEQQLLVVEFHSGASWKYSDVTRTEYDALMSAPSIGSHFHTHIRSSKTATKL